MSLPNIFSTYLLCVRVYIILEDEFKLNVDEDDSSDAEDLSEVDEESESSLGESDVDSPVKVNH